MFYYLHFFSKNVADKISYLGSGVMLLTSKLSCSAKGGREVNVFLLCACTVSNTKVFGPIVIDLYLLCSDCKNIVRIPRYHTHEMLFWFPEQSLKSITLSGPLGRITPLTVMFFCHSPNHLLFILRISYNLY